MVAYVSREHNLLVSPRTATDLVRKLVRARLTDVDLYAEVRGRDLQTGFPKTVVLSSVELRDAIRRSS